MSVENLKEYALRCAREPDLRKAANEIGVENLDAHITLSKSLGLDWKREDMLAYTRDVVNSDDIELEDLSEDELEMIAGGICTTTGVVVGGVLAGALGAGVVAAGVGGAAAGGAAAAGDGGW